MRADVSEWLRRRTYRASSYTASGLLEARQRDGCTISVVLPALDEEATVGTIVGALRCALVERVPLVDEVLVIDSGSTDRTARVAADAGARVIHVEEILPGYGFVPGKGEALWKSLYVSDGDLVVFLDSDVRAFDPHFVVGLLGPLVTDPAIGYVKGLYDRAAVTAEGLLPTGGGRVTELTARPLIGALWPHLSGFVQPLSGEYAGRRRLLEQVPFVSHYGVEFGLLVDLADLAGMDALAQVDLGTRQHSHQTDAALGRMAAQILQTALARCHDLRVPGDVRSGADVEAIPWDVGVIARPPMASVPEYRARRRVRGAGRRA
jgi:glucosyl-3-phosphoglycerate synthase